jgi:hypothetical protein
MVMRNSILITKMSPSRYCYHLVSYNRKETMLTPISKKIAKLLIEGGMPSGS